MITGWLIFREKLSIRWIWQWSMCCLQRISYLYQREIPRVDWALLVQTWWRYQEVQMVEPWAKQKLLEEIIRPGKSVAVNVSARNIFSRVMYRIHCMHSIIQSILLCLDGLLIGHCLIAGRSLMLYLHSLNGGAWGVSRIQEESQEIN